MITPDSDTSSNVGVRCAVSAILGFRGGGKFGGDVADGAKMQSVSPFGPEEKVWMVLVLLTFSVN